VTPIPRPAWRTYGRGMVRVLAASVVSIGSLIWAAGPAAAWTWPVGGEVVVHYANAGPYAAGQHRGIDVAAAIGTPVVAAAGGTVRFVGQVGSSGLTVSVRSADRRFDTSYLHLASVSVRAGQAVATGKRIGTVGISGNGSTAAPHLHFGVRVAGTRHGYRDPLAFLPPRVGFRDGPRGVPVATPSPVRVGPAPEPVSAPRFLPAPRRALDPTPTGAKAGWAVACLALIAAAALIGGGARARRGSRSSIGARALLRHHADLLRQR
jgi:murein DD-endopeptidase MepM/ murein hydrolase activator NlpD